MEVGDKTNLLLSWINNPIFATAQWGNPGKYKDRDMSPADSTSTLPYASPTPSLLSIPSSKGSPRSTRSSTSVAEGLYLT